MLAFVRLVAKREELNSRQENLFRSAAKGYIFYTSRTYAACLQDVKRILGLSSEYRDTCESATHL